MTAQRRYDRKATAGFTLFEALVAIMLMGIILAALTTITAQWLPNWNRGLAGIQRSEQIALGLDRLSADLAAAQFIPINGEIQAPFFDGTDHSVTLVRTALGPNTLPGLEFVRIAEVNSEQGPALVRTRAPFAPLDRVQPDFTDPVVLLRAPYRVSFSYAGADRLWHDDWREQIQLPRSIKMTVRNLVTGQALSTATLIHAELPVTCISAKSYADCKWSKQPPDGNKSPLQQ